MSVVSGTARNVFASLANEFWSVAGKRRTYVMYTPFRKMTLAKKQNNADNKTNSF